MEGHGGSLVYYPLSILIGMYPWTVATGPVLLFWVRSLLQSYSTHDVGSKLDARWSIPQADRNKAKLAIQLLSIWSMIYLLVFSMAATKLPNYVLPAYPAFALIFACAFDAWLASPSSYSKFWYRGSLGVLIFLGALLGIAIPVIALFAVGRSTALDSFDLAPAVQRELAWLGMLGLPALFGGGIALYLAERNRTQSALITVCASAIATVICLWNFVVPQVGHHQGPQRMINDIRGNPNLRAADIATFDFFRPTMVFYSGSAIQKCYTSQQVVSFFSERPSGVLVVDSSRLDELTQVLPQDIQVVHRIDRFPESGHLIALHRPPMRIPLAQFQAANLSTEKPAKR
jgi:hypothetical protein